MCRAYFDEKLRENEIIIMPRRRGLVLSDRVPKRPQNVCGTDFSRMPDPLATATRFLHNETVSLCRNRLGSRGHQRVQAQSVPQVAFAISFAAPVTGGGHITNRSRVQASSQHQQPQFTSPRIVAASAAHRTTAHPLPLPLGKVLPRAAQRTHAVAVARIQIWSVRASQRRSASRVS